MITPDTKEQGISNNVKRNIISNRDSNTAKTGQQNTVNLPSISLPKGGGALAGIGEKFTNNPVTGTGSFNVPIYTSPGRSGFGPQLSLSYDSGSGNGIFGFGWSISPLPSINRKTEKYLPIYQDNDDDDERDSESDVFILSGTEDLVRVLIKVKINGEWKWKREVLPSRNIDGIEYNIRRYRPRIEGLFARIERWTNIQTGEIHWRSISKDNITTLYGKTSESRISDPQDPKRIFSWLICESYDDKGNAIVYQYKAENSEKVDLSFVHERNRTSKSRSVNRYLKRIKYGNKSPYRTRENLSERTDWMFEVVFDYGEHYSENEDHLPLNVSFNGEVGHEWKIRQDPFSSYRAGFEIRTYRLCQHVLMFHHFPDELGVPDYLVKSTDFEYQENANASFISKITQSGFVRRSDGRYLKKSLPPLEFEYSQAAIKDKIQEIDSDSLENLPYGLDGTQYQWVDLDGEGLAGILTEQAGAWFYKHNLSSLPIYKEKQVTSDNGSGNSGNSTIVARFAPSRRENSIPSFSDLNDGRQQLMDLQGDGKMDLVKFDKSMSGYFKRLQDAEDWDTFIPFSSLPNVKWQDPNLRFVDLTGDGHADILITEDRAFSWYQSLAEKGFSKNIEKVNQSIDEEKGPRLVFADGTHSTYLADMSGDGLTDLVHIGNGEVWYKPNLGYGHFGSKVTMDHSPWFDMPDQFDQKRIRLADIDGSGTTDIIYLGQDGIHVFKNLSGNSLSGEQRLNTQFPHMDSLSTSMMVADLLGNGTACLVWSSSLPSDGSRTMYYIDLMGGQKPHLLISTKNNMGAETKLQYAPSTKFYLADKYAGKPWITRLPFPVHVVERVEIYDAISRSRFVSRYAYHHGYFDGTEREFRGFGLVEQWDTEEFAALTAGDTLSPPASNIDESSHVPPVLTKTWFHTGAYFELDQISKYFQNEYYPKPGLTKPRLDNILPLGLTSDEKREAYRALKGSMLHQEIYALDNTVQAEYPYSISERNYAVKLVQPQAAKNHHSVFLTHPSETIDYHYERDISASSTAIPSDPRINHSIILEVDAFGNTKRVVSIGYGRRHPDPDPKLSEEDKKKQTQTLITYTENNFTNNVDMPDSHRNPLPFENSIYELTGLNLGGMEYFDPAVVKSATATASHLDYEESPTEGLQKRLLEHTYTLYRKDDLTGPLAPGEIQPLALPFQSYQLSFTPKLVVKLYGDRVSSEMLSVKDKGCYVHFPDGTDVNWWIPSGQVFYSPSDADIATKELAFAREHFFLPHRFQDPFKNSSVITFDKYSLLLQETQDALKNIVTVVTKDSLGNDIIALDYRVLQPWMRVDLNGNRSAVAFDILGLVVGTSIMGKIGEDIGDSLDGFDSNLDEAITVSHIEKPYFKPHNILQKATTRVVYDLNRYFRTKDTPNPLPNVSYTLARETHNAKLVDGKPTKIQHAFSYSDGLGRVIQMKIQAEKGEVDSILVDTRWVGSGWTIYNNKGKPIRQYEPFFSDTHHFQFAKKVGVSSTIFYDALGRVVATLRPDHTYQKTVFDVWRQEIWDVNDTVLESDPRTDKNVGGFIQRLPVRLYLPTWYQQRKNGDLGAEEQEAAVKASAHAGTPTIIYFDTLGRPFLTIEDNGLDDKYFTRTELDIEGNQRAVIDPMGRIVMQYRHDILGNTIKQESMDAATRWVFYNISGKPVYGWDSRENMTRTIYDKLERPTHVFVQEGTSSSENLVHHVIYGEEKGDALNHRGRIFQSYDSAGLVTNEVYDFKGNLERSNRQVAVQYKNTINWTTPQEFEKQFYITQITYDALNRPLTTTIDPDKSVIKNIYNDANLLESIEVDLQGSTGFTPFVRDIAYNAKGQREFIQYGNGVATTYKYDDITFRMVNLQTLRGSEHLQDLYYVYDPVGNIIHVEDNADIHDAVFFRHKRVEPNANYTYDATYRLIDASGREHLGLTGGGARNPPFPTGFNDEPRINQVHPSDGNAMGNYSEHYGYDPAGNILEIAHRGTDPSHPGWIRTYTYSEPGKTNNHLTHTNVGGIDEFYTYDIHGNLKSMPHLPLIRWDYKDQLQATSKQKVSSDDVIPEITYYTYDSGGQRVHKVTERQARSDTTPNRKEERIYLGEFEIYREYGGDGSTIKLQRETLHVMDDTRRIALVETRVKGDGDISPKQLIRYQFSNHLGSANLELNDAGKIISYEEYYPYGSTSLGTIRNRVETSKRYRYTGKERDEESGFYYHGVRYYIPWLGRWSSCDPIGIGDGISLYIYTHNCPTRLVDPNGMQAINPDEFKVLRGTLMMVGKSGDPEIVDAWHAAVRSFYTKQEHTNGGYSYVIKKGMLQNKGVTATLFGYTDEQVEKLDRVFRKTGFAPEGSNPETSSYHSYQMDNGQIYQNLTPLQANEIQTRLLQMDDARRAEEVRNWAWGLLSAIAGVRAAQLAHNDINKPTSNKSKEVSRGKVPSFSPMSSASPPKSPPPVPGKWKEVVRDPGKRGTHIQAMFSGKELRYDKKTGRTYIEEYHLDNIYFDDFRGGVLREVKDDYSFPIYIASQTPNTKAANQILLEAQSQATVAERYGLPLEWHVRKEHEQAFRNVIGQKVPYIRIVPY